MIGRTLSHYKVLEEILQRCLTKSPRERLHDIADARLELQETPSPESSVAEKPDRRQFIGIASAAMAALAVRGLLQDSATGVSDGPPVVILMDTLAPAGVYDAGTRRNSGTNADDLNHELRGLPLALHKETVGSTWDREDQILKQEPALVLIHRSSFFHSMNLELGYGYDDVAIQRLRKS